MSATGRVTGFTGHPVGETKTNLCVGMDKGKPLTKRALPTKQVSKKGRIQKRVKFVRDIVREVVGFAPYEKRCMELLKVGKEKRALKVRAPPLSFTRRDFPPPAAGLALALHLSSGQPTFPRGYYDLRPIVPLPPPSRVAPQRIALPLPPATNLHQRRLAYTWLAAFTPPPLSLPVQTQPHARPA